MRTPPRAVGLLPGVEALRECVHQQEKHEFVCGESTIDARAVGSLPGVEAFLGCVHPQREVRTSTRTTTTASTQPVKPPHVLRHVPWVYCLE